MVVQAQTLGAVKGHQSATQERDMLLLQWQGKAIDDGAQDLQQLCDAVVALRLEYKPVEGVADRAADETPMGHELACTRTRGERHNQWSKTVNPQAWRGQNARTIDAVQDRFEVVALTRILSVE